MKPSSRSPLTLVVYQTSIIYPRFVQWHTIKVSTTHILIKLIVVKWTPNSGWSTSIVPILVVWVWYFRLNLLGDIIPCCRKYTYLQHVDPVIHVEYLICPCTCTSNIFIFCKLWLGTKTFVTQPQRINIKIFLSSQMASRKAASLRHCCLKTNCGDSKQFWILHNCCI